MGSRSAQKVTMTEIARVINSPGKKIVYRQTCNWKTRVWHRPKRRQPDGSWKTICDSLKLLGNCSNAMLLWTVWNKVDELKTNDKPRWNSKVYKVTHVGDYAYYYLVCQYTATSQSIHGIM